MDLFELEINKSIKEPSDLLETSDVVKACTGDLVDVPLHCQLRVEGNAEVAHHVRRNDK